MNEQQIKDKYIRGNKIKLNIAKIATVIMIIAAVLLSVFVLSNSSVKAKSSWVYDKSKILSDSTINTINSKNGDLYKTSGAEIVVVVEKDSSSNKDLPKRAEKLFKDYKVGDNGILFVTAIPDEKSGIGKAIGDAIDSIFGSTRYSYAYYIGRNVDYSLDSQIDSIFSDNFQSDYNSGNYNGAVLNTFNALYDYFANNNAGTTYSTANAGYTTYHNNSYGYPSAPNYNYVTVSHFGGYGLFAILPTLMVIAFIVFIIYIFTRRRGPGARRVYRSGSPFWFGLGLGGLGGLLGGMFRRNNMFRNNWNNMGGMRGRTNNNWANLFGGRSSSGGRSGGGFRNSGSSGRGGGGFRSGGSSFGGRGGGGFRGGRGGGGRR
ncbi:MAG: TPM domain-containing protein [Oscillospiraceae bacterium]|nr:TPM domain-containing protein [Oscillospiraceae bacterium]